MTELLITLYIGMIIGAAVTLSAVIIAHDERDALPGDPSREWKEGK